MPLDRMLHPRSGHSDKISALTDFEHRVWTQYLLSADDFGIMPCEAIRLQADNRALAKKSPQVVQKALERLIGIGLLREYRDPQHRRYTCDPVWQRYQHIEYPKQSINPQPPADVLAECHPLTQELFRQCFGKPKARFRLRDADCSPNDGREVYDHSGLRAPARANTATATANGLRLEAHGSGGVLTGALPREHLKCAACDPTFSRCVPAAVHAKLKGLLAPKYAGDRGQADAALQAWYPSVWASLPADFVMPDAFKFWQGRFDAAFASRDAIAFGKPEPKSTVPSVDRTAEYLRRQREAS